MDARYTTRRPSTPALRAAPERSSLRAALRDACGDAPSREAVRTLVDRCHRLATAYLRHRLRTGRLRPGLLPEPPADLAFDALGDLFARDDAGRFHVLRRFFVETGSGTKAEEERSATASLEAASEEALARRLRGLVISVTGDWLFATYGAADPGLARLIRRLKRVAKEVPGARLERRGRTLWVVACAPDASTPDASTPGAYTSDAPVLPPETLEAHVAGAVAASRDTRDLLEAALRALRCHPACRAAYPLSRLAQVLRAAEVRVNAATERAASSTGFASLDFAPDGSPGAGGVPSGGVAFEAPSLLRPEEAAGLIQASVEAVRADKAAHYLRRAGLAEATYRAYFAALADWLRAQFVPPGDPELTQHAALARHLGCSRAAYRREHRARLEHLARCTRAHFAALVRRATQGPPPAPERPRRAPA